MTTAQLAQEFSSSGVVVENHFHYLDELVMDMRDLNKQTGACAHAIRLLSEEIDRVWSVVYPSSVSQTNSNPAPGQTIVPSTPIGPRPLFSPESAVSFMGTPFTPPRSIGYNECILAMNRVYASLMASYDLVQNDVTVHEKIPLPYYPNFNFIGRILGPRGITVKQMESETGCRIFIRGRGSVKDPVREARLLNLPGWEHLSEPLHVLIEATDVTNAGAEAKLLLGVRAITPLLVPSNDEHKRRQMIQLAIINGNYRCDNEA